MNSKQVSYITEITSQTLIHRLQECGESYTTIAAETGMSRSQLSLVGNGKRELGERYFRALLKMAADKKVLFK